MDPLVYLKARTGESNEALLQSCLEDASGIITEYCGIEAVPAGLEGMLRALALRSYNRLGVEGFSSFGQAEGNSLGLGDLTKSEIATLNRHRVAIIGS